jgi:hypothetical protein
MRTTTSMRLVAALVVTSLAVAGVSPLAQAQQLTLPGESTPLEQAEQPMTPAEPVMAPIPPAEPTVAQAQPPTPPAPVMPAPPPPPAMPPAPTAQPARPDLLQETLKSQQAAADRKQALYEAGAVVTNVFLIPGRAITCALGAGLGVVVLAITFGTGYKTAAGAFDEGCGGKWVVTGDDLKPDGGSRAFEWER